MWQRAPDWILGKENHRNIKLWVMKCEFWLLFLFMFSLIRIWLFICNALIALHCCVLLWLVVCIVTKTQEVSVPLVAAEEGWPIISPESPVSVDNQLPWKPGMLCHASLISGAFHIAEHNKMRLKGEIDFKRKKKRIHDNKPSLITKCHPSIVLGL